MKDSLLEFISRFDDFYGFRAAEQLDLFAFFLEDEQSLETFNAKDIKNCFELSKIKPYSNIASYLSKNLKAPRGEKTKFLKSKNGYSLNSAFKIGLTRLVPLNKPKAKTSKSLRDILKAVNNSEQNVFLDEAIKCFEIGAYRASIIMVWNLSIAHLFEYILAKKLSNFNAVLATNTDRRVRISAISTKDDFSEIPEGKFIEFCRQSRIISNDVRKILETKLGIRNTFAHPSNVVLLESKAIAFIEDLVSNIILKYKR